MVILAIDPGFGRLGYAVMEIRRESPRVITSSCFETSPKLEYKKRLLLVGEKIKGLIAKYQPQVMALEKIFFAKNQKTALKIAEVRGILIYLAASSGIAVYEYTPLEVKMALCGYGQATKDQVRKMLKILLKLPSLPKLDDASDAIAVGFTCISSCNFKKEIH